MDPVTILGAVGSVVGIAAFGLKIAVFLDQFISDYGEAGEILATVLDGIEATLEALKQIRDLLQDEEKTLKDGKEPQLFKLKALKLIRKTSDKCLKIFWRIEGALVKKIPTDEEIKVKLEKFHSQVKDGKDEANLQLNKKLLKPLKPGRWDRWRFAFNLNEKLERYNRQLDRQQCTLVLLFQVVLLKINMAQPNSNTPYNIHLLFNQIPQTALHSGIPEVRKRRQSSYLYPPGAANPLSSRWHDEDTGYYHPPPPGRRNSRYRSRYNEPPQKDPPARRRSASVSSDRGRRHHNPNSRRRRHSLSGDEMDGIRVPEDKETKVESVASDDSEGERQLQAELRREREQEKLKAAEATLALHRKIGGRKNSDVVEFKPAEVVPGAKNGEPSSRPRYTESPTRMDEGEDESVLDSIVPQRGSFRGSVVPEKNDSGRPTPRRPPVRYQKPSVSDQPVDTPSEEKKDMAESLKATPMVFDFDPTDTILPSKEPLLRPKTTNTPGVTSGAESRVKGSDISQIPNNSVGDQAVGGETVVSTNAAKPTSVHSAKSDKSMSFEDRYGKREFQMGWKDSEAAKKPSQAASSSILTEMPSSTLPSAAPKKDVDTGFWRKVSIGSPVTSLQKPTEHQESSQITVDSSNHAFTALASETERARIKIANDISDGNSIAESDIVYGWDLPLEPIETTKNDIVAATDPLLVNDDVQHTPNLSSNDVIESTTVPTTGISSKVQEEFNPWSLKRGVSSPQKAATFSFEIDPRLKDKGKEKEIVVGLPTFTSTLPTPAPYIQVREENTVSFDTPEAKVHELNSKPIEKLVKVDDVDSNKKSNTPNDDQNITTHQPVDEVGHSSSSCNEIPFWQQDDSDTKNHQEIPTSKNTTTDFANITSNPSVSSQRKRSTAITDLLRNGLLPEPEPETETVADSVINAWVFAIIAKRNRKKDERIGASTEALKEKPNEDLKVATSPDSMAMILHPDREILKRMWQVLRPYQPTFEDGDDSAAHSVSGYVSFGSEGTEELERVREEELKPITFMPDNEIVSEASSYRDVPEETISNTGRFLPGIWDGKLARSSVDTDDNNNINVENLETPGPIDDRMSGALPFVEESSSRQITPLPIVEDISNNADDGLSDWGTFTSKKKKNEKETDVAYQTTKSGDRVEEATETPKIAVKAVENASDCVIIEDLGWGAFGTSGRKTENKKTAGSGEEPPLHLDPEPLGRIEEVIEAPEEVVFKDLDTLASKKKASGETKSSLPPPLPVAPLPPGVTILDTTGSKTKTDQKKKSSLPPPLPKFLPLAPGVTIVDTSSKLKVPTKRGKYDASLSTDSLLNTVHAVRKPWYKRASPNQSNYVTVDGVEYKDKRGSGSLASKSVTSSNFPRPLKSSRFMKGVIRSSALVAGLLGVTENRYQTGFISAFVIKDGECHQIPHNGRFMNDGFSKMKSNKGTDWWKEYAFLSPNDLAALKVLLEEKKDYEKTLVQLKHLQKAKFQFWSTNEEVLIAIVSNEVRRGYSSGSSSVQDLPLDQGKLVEEEKNDHVSSAPKITEIDEPEPKAETGNEPSYESQRSCLAYTIRVLFPHTLVGDVAGITCQREPFSEIDIIDQIARLNANGASIVQKKINLIAAQNEEIEKLLVSLVPKDRDVDYAWTLAQLEDHDSPGQRTTTVYLRRQFLSPKVIEEEEPVDVKLPTPGSKKDALPKPAIVKTSSISGPKPSVKFEDQAPKKKVAAETKASDKKQGKVEVTVSSFTDSESVSDELDTLSESFTDEIEPSDSASAVRQARESSRRRSTTHKRPSPPPSVEGPYPGYRRGYPPPASGPAGIPQHGFAPSVFPGHGMLPYGSTPGMHPYPGHVPPPGILYPHGAFPSPPPSVESPYPGYGRGYPPPASGPAGVPQHGYAPSVFPGHGMLPYGSAPGMHPYHGHVPPPGILYPHGAFPTPPPGYPYLNVPYPAPPPGHHPPLVPGGYPVPTFPHINPFTPVLLGHSNPNVPYSAPFPGAVPVNSHYPPPTSGGLPFPVPDHSNPFLPRPPATHPQGSYYPGYGYMGAPASSQNPFPPPHPPQSFPFGMGNDPAGSNQNPTGPPNANSYPGTPRPNARSYFERYDDEYPDVPEAPHIDSDSIRRRASPPPTPPPAPRRYGDPDRPSFLGRQSSLDTFDRKPIPTQPPMDRSLRLQSREVTRPSFLDHDRSIPLSTEFNEKRKPPSPQPLVSYGRPGMNVRRDTMFADLYGEESGPNRVPAYESTMAIRGGPPLSTRTIDGGERSAYSLAAQSHFSKYGERESAIPLTRQRAPYYPEYHDGRSFNINMNDEEEKNDLVQKLLKHWTPDVKNEDEDVKGKGKEKVDGSGEKVKDDEKENEDEEESSDSDSDDDDWSEVNGYGGVKLAGINAPPQSQHVSRAGRGGPYEDGRDYYSRLQSDRNTVDASPVEGSSRTRQRELMAPVRRQSYSSRAYVPPGNRYTSAPSMLYNHYSQPLASSAFPIIIPRQPGVERPVARMLHPPARRTQPPQRNEKDKATEIPPLKPRAAAPAPSRPPEQKSEARGRNQTTITIDTRSPSSTSLESGITSLESHERISSPLVTREGEREREHKRSVSSSPERERVRTRAVKRPVAVVQERERVRSFSPGISLDEYLPTRTPINPLHATVREDTPSPVTHSRSDWEEMSPSVTAPRTTRDSERIPRRLVHERERVRSFSPGISLDEYDVKISPIKPLTATMLRRQSRASISESEKRRSPSPVDRIPIRNAAASTAPQSYEERRKQRGQQRQNSTYASKERETNEHSIRTRQGESSVREPEDLERNATRTRTEELERIVHENTMRGLEATLKLARENGDRTRIHVLEEQKKGLASQESARREKQSEENHQKQGFWTEITKDLVAREAIEQLGYEFEETELFFYITRNLSYEHVLELVQLSETIRGGIKQRVGELEQERERVRQRETAYSGYQQRQREREAATYGYQQYAGGPEPSSNRWREQVNTGGEWVHPGRSERDVAIDSRYPADSSNRINDRIYHGERPNEEAELGRRARMQRSVGPGSRHEDRDTLRSQMEESLYLRARNEEISRRSVPEPRAPPVERTREDRYR